MKRSCPDGIDFDNEEWDYEESLVLYPLDEDKGIWFGNSRPALIGYFSMLMDTPEADMQAATKKLLEVIAARHEKCLSIGRAVDVLMRRPCFKDANLETWTDILLKEELVHWNDTFMEGEHYTDHKGLQILQALHYGMYAANADLSFIGFIPGAGESKPLEQFRHNVLGRELAWEEMAMEIGMLWSATHDFVVGWQRYNRRDGDGDEAAMLEEMLTRARLLYTRHMVIQCKAYIEESVFGQEDSAERDKAEDANFCYGLEFTAEEMEALQNAEDSDAKPVTYSQCRLYNQLRTRVARLYHKQPRKKATFAKLRIYNDLSKGEKNFYANVQQQAAQV